MVLDAPATMAVMENTVASKEVLKNRLDVC